MDPPQPTTTGTTQPTIVDSEPPALPSDHHISKVCFRSVIPLVLIFLINCVFCAAICLGLFGFARIPELERWQKRLFNTLALLFSAGLGFGIGCLFDQIGLFARGALLQRTSHSVADINYIFKGTPWSYARLAVKHFSNPRISCNSTTLIVSIFLFCSFVGRFGIAFVGFAFTLEESLDHTASAPLLRAEWVNGSMHTDGKMGSSCWFSLVISPLREYSTTNIVLAVVASWGLGVEVLDNYFHVAQLMHGAQNDINYYPDESQPSVADQFRAYINLKRFETGKTIMNVGDQGIVTMRYSFQDYQGGFPVPAYWEAVIETRCERFEILKDQPERGSDSSPYIRYWKQGRVLELPLLSANLELVPLSTSDLLPTEFRWISQERYTNRVRNSSIGTVLQTVADPAKYNYTMGFWLVGSTGSVDLTPAPEPQLQYIKNYPILFNCSLSLHQMATKHRPFRSDFHSQSGRTFIMSDKLHSLILYFWHGAPSEFVQQVRLRNGTEVSLDERYRDYNPGVLGSKRGFYYGVGRGDKTESEIWLAAFVGNYITNILLFMNGMFTRNQIEGGSAKIDTKLDVRWDRVALTLGGLTMCQIILTCIALWLCWGKLELQDNVSEFPFIFKAFAREGTGEGNHAYFVPEGNGSRFRLHEKT